MKSHPIFGSNRVAKGEKKHKLRVTVFPSQGGQPYVTDVQVDSEGYFTLKGETGQYRVAKNSTWEEAGIHRSLVNAANPQTINPFTLTGDDIMHPIALHGVAKNNLWVQLHRLANRQSLWKQGSTWGFLAIGIGLLLLVLWQVRTIGAGFEELANAMETIRNAGGAGTTPGTEAGHQPIAPGGQ